MSPRIFLADDHDIVREGIKFLLKARPNWIVCGEASNGKDAVLGVYASRPDVAVLDISMPELSGLEAAKQIYQATPDVKILFFTMHDSKSLMRAARDAGAHGLVLKSFAARDLVRAIEMILAGESFFESGDPKHLKHKESARSPFLFLWRRSALVI
jgi:DNA-binding NarL/FixJ family response regulator